MTANLLNFDAYISSRTVDFVKREWVFKDIDGWLADPDGARYYILSGEPGSGKSAVMARYTQIRKLHAVHFCIADQADTIDPIAFTRSLAHQLCSLDAFAVSLLEEQGTHVDVRINVRKNYGTIIGVKVENLLINPPSPQVAFNHSILLPLKKMFATDQAVPVLILVDGLDESEQFGGGSPIYELLSGLASLDARVRFLLSVRSNTRAERRFNDLPAKRLVLGAAGATNLDDLHAYITHKSTVSNAVKAMLAKTGMPLASFIAILDKKHQNNFNYLVQLFAALDAGEPWADDLTRLPGGLDGIYREHLRTRAIGRDAGLWRAYRPILGVLAAAAEPLTLEQISAFSAEPDLQTVDDVLQDAGQYLDTNPGPEPRYRIYHQSLADFLKDRQRSGEFWINLPAVHDKIAAAYRNFIDQGDWSACDDYGLRHLVGHLAGCGAVEDLTRVLFDFAWMDARLKQSNIQALISDYQAALAFLAAGAPASLRLLRDFFKLSALILAGEPEQLAGQLHGRLGGSSDPSIQALLAQASKKRGAHWLRPVQATFLPPGKSLLRTLTGHGAAINAVILTDDGKLGVSVSADGVVKVWDIEAETERSSYSLGVDATSLALLPDGQHFLCGTRDGRLIKMSLVTGSPVHTWTEHLPGWVRGLAVTPDGELALVGVDRDLALIRLKDGTLAGKMGSADSGAGMLAVSPDGKYGLAGGVYDYLAVWEIESGKQIAQLSQGMDTWVSALAVTPDWSLAASGDWDGQMIFWDLKNYRRLANYVAGGFNRISALALTPDGKRAIATVTNEGMYVIDLEQIWSQGAVNRINFLDLFKMTVNSIAITPDGNRSITVGSDYTLRYWSLLQMPVEAAPMISTQMEIPAEPLSGESQESLFSIYSNGDEDEDYQDATFAIIRRRDDPAWQVIIDQGRYHRAAVSTNGKRAVFAWRKMQVWDLQSCEMLSDWGFPENLFKPDWIGIAPDGATAALRFQKKLFLVDLKSGEFRLLSSDVDENVGVWIASSWIAAGLADHSVSIWSLGHGTLLAHLGDDDKQIRSCWLGNPGEWFVTSGMDGRLEIWDLTVLTNPGEKLRPVIAAEMHPQCDAKIFGQKFAVSLSGDGEALVCDISAGFGPPDATLKPITAPVIGRFKAHSAAGYHLAWSDHCKDIVLTTSGNSLECWDVRAGTRLAGILGDRPFARVNTAFSPHTDETLWIWAWDEKGARHLFRFEPAA